MKWTDKLLNILLIDKDEDTYILIRRLLAEINDVKFRLDWEKTYQAGLDTAIGNQHDACLVAYHLDGHTGLDFLRETIKRGCQGPLILLTEQANREIDLAAMESGAADYLAKNQVGPLLLERSIRYASERKRDEAELREAQNSLEQGIVEQTAEL